MTPELFTLGHSTQSLESFLSLLHRHGITAVADVRSQPFSGQAPQFNGSVLPMICRNLRAEFAIAHVLGDGELLAHEDAERQLLDLAGLDEADLFMTRDQLIDEAYRICGERIEYSLREAEAS